MKYSYYLILNNLMNNYIYILDLTIMNNKIQIGSTKFPYSKLNSYQTNFPFNVNYLKLYKITSDDYDCYQVENLIKQSFVDIITNNGFADNNKFNNEVIENFFINNKINFQLVNIEDCSKDKSFDEYKKELLIKNN